MHDKEQFDAIMALAQFRAERRDKRMVMEWRVSLGIWALLAAGIVYSKPFPQHWLLACWFGAVALHCWWVWINFCAAERDSDHFYHMLSRAENLVLPKVFSIVSMRQKRKWDRARDFVRHGPVIFQLLATAALGAAMYFVSREAPAAHPPAPAVSATS